MNNETVEILDKILMFSLLGIFIMIILVNYLDNDKMRKKLREGKYYSVETINIFRYITACLFVLFFYIPFTRILIVEGINIAILVTMIIIALIFVLIIYFSLRQTIKFEKEKKQILNNGIKLEGNVIEEHIEEDTAVGQHGIARSFYMIVEYTYNGEKKTYMTPQVNFNFSQLKDTNVDVYVYNDKVFVTNFKLK